MRVVVAMSGGVDSSVVAGLLHEAGHDVVGVTLQLYDHGQASARKGACCAGKDIHDARDVADRLGIPHYVIDAEARFKTAVIDDFAASYAAGETPVPCVRCNQGPKFTDLLGMARELGATRLGHRSLRAPRRSAGRGGVAQGGRPAARPELVPVRHHAQPVGVLPLSAGRHAGQGRHTLGRRAVRPCGRREAGQPGHLLRSAGKLRRAGWAIAAGFGGSGRDRHPGWLGGRAAPGHRALHGGSGQAAGRCVQRRRNVPGRGGTGPGKTQDHRRTAQHGHAPASAATGELAG